MMKLARRIVAAVGVGERAQTGAAVVLVAASMTILLGFAAFSVDFGWLYLNAVRIQHGADAAALAGVVYEPGDQAEAYSTALEIAADNGYVDGMGSATVTPIDYADDPSAVENQYQLRVTVSDTVDTFFMRIFGFDSITVTKHAIAEYVLPLPMGSNLPYFGEDPSIPGHDPHFWANIHGYYTGRSMGDRFSSQCAHDGSGSGCAKNTDRRATTYSSGIPATGGYLYGIEVPDGASDLAVEVFDAPFYYGGGDNVLVGDNEQGATVGPSTWFILYAPDPTPLNTTDNTVLCSVKYDPEDSFADFNGDGSVNAGDDQNGDGKLDWSDVEIGLPGGVASLWDRLCGTVFNSGPGVYPLRVVIDDPGPVDARGLNRYSLRASANGGSPRVYGLGDMSVYVNFSGNTSTFNLAEVQPVHAGKTLVIELWDPDSGNNGTQIFMPDGTSPPCTWSNLDGTRGATLGSCDINYSTGFNDDHMQIRVDVPDDYTCSGNCWWTIEVSYPGGANDTTTWSARIEGNPVALVE
jgi:hypothetical protein